MIQSKSKFDFVLRNEERELSEAIKRYEKNCTVFISRETIEKFGCDVFPVSVEMEGHKFNFYREATLENTVRFFNDNGEIMSLPDYRAIYYFLKKCFSLLDLVPMDKDK